MYITSNIINKVKAHTSQTPDGKTIIVIPRQARTPAILIDADAVGTISEPDLIEVDGVGEVVMFSESDNDLCRVQILTDVVGIFDVVQEFTREESHSILDNYQMGDIEDIYYEFNRPGTITMYGKPKSLSFLGKIFFLDGGLMVVDCVFGRTVFLNQDGSPLVVDYDGSIRKLLPEEMGRVTFYTSEEIYNYCNFTNYNVYKQPEKVCMEYTNNQIHNIAFSQDASGCKNLSYVSMDSALAKGLEFEKYVKKQEPTPAPKPKAVHKSHLESSQLSNAMKKIAELQKRK